MSISLQTSPCLNSPLELGGAPQCGVQLSLCSLICSQESVGIKK